MVVGNAIVRVCAPIAAIAIFDTEKLRSLNSPSGTNGSLRLMACHTIKRVNTMMPAIIMPHTLTGIPVPHSDSVIVPQS